MIYEVEGDILLTEAQAICHSVAPNDDFKKGLAMSLRENFPDLYKDFRHFSHAHHPKEGTLWVWVNAEGKRIFNLFIQEHAKGHTSHPGAATIPYLNSALKDLRHILQAEKIGSLALPKLGTGVGHLKWNEVNALIEKHLGDMDIPIYVYSTYHKNQKAKEPS
jgi:O-acetyl-ADP-ribose deacetylase (regulator of RNase III)